MRRLTKGPMLFRTQPEVPLLLSCGAYVKFFWVLALAGTMMFSACGGASSGSGSQQSGTLTGNWQFSMSNPDPAYPSDQLYGLQGGFLLQRTGSVTGQAVYSVSGISQSNGQWTVCNGGSATITGTINGQTVNLTAVAGSQTFTLTGTLGSDGSITNSTFTTTGGAATGFTTCGIPTPTGTTTTSWSAKAVPPLTGAITGRFHSTSTVGASGLADQEFPVTGFLTQGQNTGASNATITGTLSFIDPLTQLSDYPCVPDGSISVNGQISGNSVILQLIGTDGSNVGQIGAPAGTGLASNVGTWPVTLNSTANGYVLQSQTTPAYVVNTKPCFNGTKANHEDSGNICLALNSATACQQPITMSPAVLIFSPQLLGSTPTTQTITLTNTSGTTLSDLPLAWNPGNPSDFTGQPSFIEADNCAASLPLSAGGSCTIKVTFDPQQSCPWLPFGDPPTGAPPAQCPFPLTATVTATSPSSPDHDTSFAVPITGTGISFVQPSAVELDFGAEAVGEASLPQLLSFTNHTATPVQILASVPCVNTVLGQFHMLPHPLDFNSPVAGLQVVSDVIQDFPNSTIDFSCDWDLTSQLSNFQISSDTCSGTLLGPQATCSLKIAFVPQVSTDLNGRGSGLDYFLELNTVQCPDPVNDPPSQSNPCEIDGGRFPVELRANLPSPLRMSPGAGLDFGSVTVSSASVQQTITIFNDPADPKSATVNFSSRAGVSGNYSETDDCPFSLEPGRSCTLTVTFKPKAVGFNQGTLTITYTTDQTIGPQTQTVYLRGSGQ